MAGFRYFEGEHPELEGRLEEHFERMRAAFVGRGLTGALVLGGGYGRGEGGVMEGPDGLSFSNDLDYCLFDPAPDKRGLAAWCAALEKKESERLGIDVEIKRLRPEDIGDPSRTMMFADLVAGHVVVAGDGAFLERLREDLDFSKIEAVEAVRLMWNRGSGLFFALCRSGREGEKGFVIRNHAKLKLALGDAWLCLQGKHTPLARERHERLLQAKLPPNLAWLRDWHAEGLAFKRRPVADGPGWPELEAERSRLVEAWERVFLQAEGRRLDIPLDSFDEYLIIPRLFPATPLWRNLALALRDKIRRGDTLRPRDDYPRGALMRALPCLLGRTSGGVAETGRFLPRPAGDGLSEPRTWETEYARWWACYA